MATAVIAFRIPDLRAVSLADTPSLSLLTLDAAVRRVLPGTPGPARGAVFSSAI